MYVRFMPFYWKWGHFISIDNIDNYITDGKKLKTSVKPLNLICVSLVFSIYIFKECFVDTVGPFTLYVWTLSTVAIIIV